MVKLPRTARGRETRERILKAAAELLHLRGVHGTSVDDVLEASGTGKSQFYLYFQSKEELVHAVLQHRSDRWHAKADEVLGKLDTWAGFEEWFRRTRTNQANNAYVGGCPIGTLAAEMADSNDALRQAIAKEFDARRSMIVAGLQKMKDRGELVPESDPVAMGDFVLATIQGGLLLSRTEKSGRALDNALTHVMAHLKQFAVESTVAPGGPGTPSG